ncbi:cohesin domain-containing protein [Pseudobacteroides cellulosolvens]|uniref:Cellulosome anchoring protein cohesin region n=1 Tax=Pseudobacteroides cellulosolvens ATCC 35603 = DSM 2933 TaxID=398512 RepID=A0A0L6JK83_9FIRM|nr:cohesin domain-containing protein [Pseudobacteroides cellulosolvens]KNY25767.1 cellulosome anchoring protein cohesin region [Pseudobacteroides cellulosolvens ATCC 35603 = DSM 2933]
MKKSRILLVLALVLVFSSLSLTSVFADSLPSIGIELDKTEAKVGDIIKATIKANDIKNLNGFQLNMRFNQEVLKIVSEDGSESFDDKTCPENGELIMNKNYSLFPAAENIISAGVLNFGRTYIDMGSYRQSNKPESTGSLAVLYFKVIKDAATEIVFEELGTMPGSNKGTLLFDWDGNTIKEYSVNDSTKINPNSSPAPLPKYTVKPISRPVEQPTAEKNNNIYIIILVAVIAIVVLLLFVFIFAGKNKSSGDDNLDNEEGQDEYDDEGQSSEYDETNDKDNT